MASTLNIPRAALSKMADNDAQTTRSLEAMVKLTNLTGFGASQLAGDVALDTTGVTFAVTLGVGHYFVDLVVMVDVSGGSPTDGANIASAHTAGLAAGWLAVAVGTVSTTPTVTPIANDDSAFGLIGDVGCSQIRGFIDVQQPGLVGFTVKMDGAPASATLLAGSGLTTTLQREVT